MIITSLLTTVVVTRAAFGAGGIAVRVYNPDSRPVVVVNRRGNFRLSNARFTERDDRSRPPRAETGSDLVAIPPHGYATFVADLPDPMWILSDEKYRLTYREETSDEHLEAIRNFQPGAVPARAFGALVDTGRTTVITLDGKKGKKE
ncbi:MAG: hypothetical protein ACO1SV_08680 [Fimbriimonas sp.]